MNSNRLAANLCGFAAIALWGALALFTTSTGAIPPLQLNAMTFAVGGLAALAIVAVQGKLDLLIQPPIVWLHGLYGLFGFHALFFTALKLAPAAEANLINYLWPLLIVLFSALLPGEKLLPRHIVGALTGFIGTVIIVVFGKGLSGGLSSTALWGFAAAFGCALIWSSYSVTARLLPGVPTEAVTGICLATALLSAVLHLLLEKTVWPDGFGQWLTVIGLGLGPVAAAFFLWDFAMKRGNVQLLGTTAYAAPLISTALLIAFGRTEPSWTIALAALLIVAGAVISSWDAISAAVAGRNRHSNR